VYHENRGSNGEGNGMKQERKAIKERENLESPTTCVDLAVDKASSLKLCQCAEVKLIVSSGYAKLNAVPADIRISIQGKDLSDKSIARPLR
jgi:hypothetical protein